MSGRLEPNDSLLVDLRPSPIDEGPVESDDQSKPVPKKEPPVNPQECPNVIGFIKLSLPNQILVPREGLIQLNVYIFPHSCGRET